MDLAIFNQSTANRGDQCQGEIFVFRIGHETPDAVQFSANDKTFHPNLMNAIIEWFDINGSFTSLNIQVTENLKRLGEAGWRNLQNPKSGSIIAITTQIASEHETTRILYRWSCNTVQMGRDLVAMSKTIASDSTNP